MIIKTGATIGRSLLKSSVAIDGKLYGLFIVVCKDNETEVIA